MPLVFFIYIWYLSTHPVQAYRLTVWHTGMNCAHMSFALLCARCLPVFSSFHLSVIIFKLPLNFDSSSFRLLLIFSYYHNSLSDPLTSRVSRLLSLLSSRETATHCSLRQLQTQTLFTSTVVPLLSLLTSTAQIQQAISPPHLELRHLLSSAVTSTH